MSVCSISTYPNFIKICGNSLVKLRKRLCGINDNIILKVFIKSFTMTGIKDPLTMETTIRRFPSLTLIPGIILNKFTLFETTSLRFNLLYIFRSSLWAILLKYLFFFSRSDFFKEIFRITSNFPGGLDVANKKTYEFSRTRHNSFIRTHQIFQENHKRYNNTFKFSRRGKMY